MFFSGINRTPRVLPGSETGNQLEEGRILWLERDREAAKAICGISMVWISHTWRAPARKKILEMSQKLSRKLHEEKLIGT